MLDPLIELGLNSARVCVYYTEMCVAAVSLYDQMTINS